MNKADTNPEQQSQVEGGAEETSKSSSLEEQLEAAEAARDENEDRWKRAVADLENYRRRAQKEMADEREYQLAAHVRSLLPCLDNLQRAIEAANNSHNVDELIQGVQMVAKQLEDTLLQNSVVPIEAVGQPFDPNLHEAIQQLPSTEYDPMVVMNEVEKGYRINDRVVRPSKVIVSSGPPATESE